MSGHWDKRVISSYASRVVYGHSRGTGSQEKSHAPSYDVKGRYISAYTGEPLTARTRLARPKDRRMSPTRNRSRTRRDNPRVSSRSPPVQHSSSRREGSAVPSSPASGDPWRRHGSSRRTVRSPQWEDPSEPGDVRESYVKMLPSPPQSCPAPTPSSQIPKRSAAESKWQASSWSEYGRVEVPPIQPVVSPTNTAAENLIPKPVKDKKQDKKKKEKKPPESNGTSRSSRPRFNGDPRDK